MVLLASPSLSHLTSSEGERCDHQPWASANPWVLWGWSLTTPQRTFPKSTCSPPPTPALYCRAQAPGGSQPSLSHFSLPVVPAVFLLLSLRMKSPWKRLEVGKWGLRVFIPPWEFQGIYFSLWGLVCPLTQRIRSSWGWLPYRIPCLLGLGNLFLSS